MPDLDDSEGWVTPVTGSEGFDVTDPSTWPSNIKEENRKHPVGGFAAREALVARMEAIVDASAPSDDVNPAMVAARVLAAAVLSTLRCHDKFSIYTECDHEHTDEDLIDGRCVDVEDVGLTCDLMYRVCSECCTTDSGEQSEACADGHDHVDGWLCPTVEILTASLGSLVL